MREEQGLPNPRKANFKNMPGISQLEAVERKHGVVTKWLSQDTGKCKWVHAAPSHGRQEAELNRLR